MDKTVNGDYLSLLFYKAVAIKIENEFNSIIVPYVRIHRYEHSLKFTEQKDGLSFVYEFEWENEELIEIKNNKIQLKEKSGKIYPIILLQEKII